MNKQNQMLAMMEAKIKARLEAEYQAKLNILTQMGLDAGMIAANDTLKMGAGRAPDFQRAYIDAINEISRMIVEDSKADLDIEWSRQKVDDRLKKIVGEENFVPWDERYKF